jgi:hypothetical protein
MAYLSGDQFRNTQFEDLEWLDETRGSDAPIQGLLFHPSTAMQTFEDPLENYDKRHETIEMSFMTKIYKNVLDKAVREGLTVSDIPTSVFRETKNILIAPEKNRRSATFQTSKIWSTEPRRTGTLIGSIKIPADDEHASYSLVHEFGHARDFNIHGIDSSREADTELSGRTVKIGDQKFNIAVSPIAEGVADGYSDRYTWNGISERQPVAYIDPAINAEGAATVATVGGYTARYHGWRTRQSQAVYAATRMHVAHHGEYGIKSLPNFNEHYKHYVNLHEKENRKASDALKFSEIKEFDKKKAQVHARHGYLGELLHTNPALHAGLTHLGFGDVADSAIQYRHKQQVIKAAKESTQPALPGFKTNEEVALSQLKNTNPMASPMTAKQLRRTDPHSRGAKAIRTRELNKKYWGR